MLTPSGQEDIIDTGFESHSNIHYSSNGKVAYMVAGSSTAFPKVIKLNIAERQVTVLRESITVSIDTAYYSHPKEISWDTTDGEKSHGYYYAPKV